MRTPKVSVLIPTYNYGRFLPVAIESVLEQDFEDYELLIVDDRSPDNTAGVMEHFAAKDPRIQCRINSTNLGMVQNWNYCMSLARGEYIKFLFGDDTFADRRALGKLVTMLDDNPTAALAVSARKIIDEHSKWVDTWDYLGKSGRYEGKKTIMRCLIRDQNLIGEPSAVLFRKAQGLRGFNLNLRQIVDLEMWIHLLEQGDLIYSREMLCCFRQHAQQQTVVNNKNKVGETERLLLLNNCLNRPWFANATVKDRLGLVNSLRHLPQTSQKTALREKYLCGISMNARLIHWLGKKLMRPCENLNRSIRKRLIRFKFLALFSRDRARF